MRSGRLIRDNQQDGAQKSCFGCRHAIAAHLELDSADPRYRVLEFHCRECDCVVNSAGYVIPVANR